MGGFGLTEPDAGSDAGGTRTTAVKRGKHYVLNGTKSWITNGGEAGLYLAYALSDPGITAFLVPADTPGLRADTKEKKLAQHGSTFVKVQSLRRHGVFSFNGRRNRDLCVNKR